MPVTNDTRCSTPTAITDAFAEHRVQHRWLRRCAILPRGRSESANPLRRWSETTQYPASVAHGPGTKPNSTRASFLLCFRKAPPTTTLRGTLRYVANLGWSCCLLLQAPPRKGAELNPAAIPNVVATHGVQDFRPGPRQALPRQLGRIAHGRGSKRRSRRARDRPRKLPGIIKLCLTSRDVSKTA